MKKAVFLDRDGVLNELIFNPATQEYESPHRPEELQVFPYVTEALLALQKAGYTLFVVSNQPSFAKKKTTLENIHAIAAKLQQHLENSGVKIQEFFYCYHHPDGLVPEYSGPCQCRKPKPFFLLQAAQKYDVDLSSSWMIGDQDTDIECGKSAGVRTALLLNPLSKKKRQGAVAEILAQDLESAAESILREQEDAKT